MLVKVSWLALMKSLLLQKSLPPLLLLLLSPHPLPHRLQLLLPLHQLPPALHLLRLVGPLHLPLLQKFLFTSSNMLQMLILMLLRSSPLTVELLLKISCWLEDI